MHTPTLPAPIHPTDVIVDDCTVLMNSALVMVGAGRWLALISLALRSIVELERRNCCVSPIKSPCDFHFFSRPISPRHHYSVGRAVALPEGAFALGTHRTTSRGPVQRMKQVLSKFFMQQLVFSNCGQILSLAGPRHFFFGVTANDELGSLGIYKTLEVRGTLARIAELFANHCCFRQSIVRALR